MWLLNLINVQNTVTLFKDYPFLYVLNDTTTSWLYLPPWCAHEAWKCCSLHSTGRERVLEQRGKGLTFQNIWVPSGQKWDFSQGTRWSCIYILFCVVAGPQCCNKCVRKDGIEYFWALVWHLNNPHVQAGNAAWVHSQVWEISSASQWSHRGSGFIQGFIKASAM